MDELCEQMNSVSVLNPEEEYILMEKTLSDLKGVLDVEDLKYLLSNVNDLFRRYLSVWMYDIEYNGPFGPGIKKGTESFIKNYKQNLSLSEMRILRAISMSVLKMIIDTIE